MNVHVSVGGIIGGIAFIIVMWGTPPGVMAASAFIGFFFGSFIGMLLWLSASAGLPEQAVVPPFPGDACASGGCHDRRNCPTRPRCIACRVHASTDRRISGGRATASRRRKVWLHDPPPPSRDRDGGARGALLSR